jgi:REP element-mobilizing transposase RayT
MSDMHANLKGNSGLTLTPAARQGNSGLTPAARREPPDRYWFLTWTTYGTWLPGDDRGFVSNIDHGDGKGHRLNIPGTEPASRMRGLEIMARSKMTGPPVFLILEQATALLDQFRETAAYRSWELIAVAIMRNHVHVVVGVPGDPEPEALLGSLKSYGSRRLNREFGKRESDTWWTESGSRRRLKTESNVLAAIAYVRDQEYPLIVWIADQWSPELASGGRESAVSESAVSESAVSESAVSESAVSESAVSEGIPDSVKQGADAPRSPKGER